MNGFDILREQIKGQKDRALIQTVEYLLTRDDMQEKYLNQEKNIKEMAKFIRDNGIKKIHEGWNYIPDKVVFAWAIMYWSFSNSFLKIKNTSKKKEKEQKENQQVKNNVIQLEDAKKQLEEKEEVEQISLFGGVA